MCEFSYAGLGCFNTAQPSMILNRNMVVVVVALLVRVPSSNMTIPPTNIVEMCFRSFDISVNSPSKIEIL